jgi:hypothetical protein
MIPEATALGLSIRIAAESGFPDSGPEQQAIMRGCLAMHRLILDVVTGGRCSHCRERWVDHGGVEEPICRDPREAEVTAQ